MIALTVRQTDRQVKCRTLKVKQDLAFARSNNVLSWRALDQDKENRLCYVMMSPQMIQQDLLKRRLLWQPARAFLISSYLRQCHYQDFVSLGLRLYLFAFSMVLKCCSIRIIVRLTQTNRAVNYELNHMTTNKTEMELVYGQGTPLLK